MCGGDVATEHERHLKANRRRHLGEVDSDKGRALGITKNAVKGPLACYELVESSHLVSSMKYVVCSV